MEVVLQKREPPDARETALKPGVATKRHEFVSLDTKNDALVVFEGEEDVPFWRRGGDGIRFSFTNLTLAQVVTTSERSDSFLTHSIFDTDGGEFMEYYRQAWENHTR